MAGPTLSARLRVPGADLLLVDADPLMDVTALRRPAGVLLAGRWLDRATLDRMVADLSAWNQHA
jgi:hypothetical protein